MRLEGRRIVITGGATGIGAATARLCAQEGAQVVIGDVNEGEAARLVDAIRREGGEAWNVVADVADEGQVRALMEEARRRMGGIDGLVTAAAVARDSLVPVDQLPMEGWLKTLEVNLTGSFLAARHAVPAMREAGGGVIVMVASGAGVRGPSSMVAYGASKGGVHGLAMTLAAQLEGDGIRVNTLCPGNIATPLKLGIIEEQVRRAGQAARREQQLAGLGDPEGVARVIVFLLSRDADYVRGAVFTR